MKSEKPDFIILQSPSIEAAHQAAKEALSKRRNLILVGNCSVEYQGRARSLLEPGERIVLVKSDGAMLVHRPTGSEPVNWQPSGCMFRSTLSPEAFVLHATRKNPDESLAVFFTDIQIMIAAKLVDIGDFNLHVSEKELQKVIFAHPSLLLSDLKPITYEKKIEPGFIDIYGLDSAGRLVVAELKRVRAGKAAVLQLARYVEYVKGTTPLEVRGVLAAPQIAKGVQAMVSVLGLEFVQIDLKRFAESISGKTDRRMGEFMK